MIRRGGEGERKPQKEEAVVASGEDAFSTNVHLASAETGYYKTATVRLMEVIFSGSFLFKRGQLWGPTCFFPFL